MTEIYHEQMINIEGWFVDTLQVLNNALIIAGTQWVQLLDARRSAYGYLFSLLLALTANTSVFTCYC